MKNIVCLSLILFFFACDSDSIQTTPYNGVEFEQHIFKLDSALQSFQNDLSTISKSNSSLLFSGYASDPLIGSPPPLRDPVKTIVSIDLSKFSEYQYAEICSEVVHIEVPKISLYSPLKLIDITDVDGKINNLSIKLLSPDNSLLNEEEITLTENGDYSELEISNIEDEDLGYTVVDSSGNNELIINLPDLFINGDSTKLACDNHINLLIEYLPPPPDSDEDSSIQFIEWYSSDMLITEDGYPPKINLDYIKIESVDTTEYQFSLDSTSYSNTMGCYFISDELNSNWSTTYFVNIQGDDLEIEIDSLIDFNDDLVITEPLINSAQKDFKIDLGTLTIKLNDNPPSDSIPEIVFALSDVIAYVNSADPSGDNYYEHCIGSNEDGDVVQENITTEEDCLALDPIDITYNWVTGDKNQLTENNFQYDYSSNSVGTIIGKEKFDDFGRDNCEDQNEAGNDNCCNDDETCVYNDSGTENNGVRNWTDNDGDGDWDDGEGEQWNDMGSDGCIDLREDGLGGCCPDGGVNCAPVIEDISEWPCDNYDLNPNCDNYNPDPADDNYDDECQLCKEGNGILDWDEDDDGWQTGEGEQWLDYGLDGLPETGDFGENDNNWQTGEPFFDYGEDNIRDQDEDGFCNSKVICTEENFQYDIGELNSDDDLGFDNCPDLEENGSGECCEEGEENCPPIIEDISAWPCLNYSTDPNCDNYNIDPNDDNYNYGTDSGFENNGELDWDEDDDGWQVGEGERWYDYGLDHMEDNYEQYLPQNQVIVSLGANNYVIDVVDGNENNMNYEQPSTGANGVALWISKITDNGNKTYDLVISIFSKKELDGIKFNLDHPEDNSNLKVTWTEDYERHYIEKESLYNNLNGEEKIFNDFSLYPLHALESFSESLPDNLVLMNYAYDIFCKIQLDEFNAFINNYPSDAISLVYSKIVIPIDTSFTTIDDILRVDLELNSEEFSDSLYSSSGTYLNYLIPSGSIGAHDYNLEIPIGDLLQYHVVKDIPFNGFILKNNSKSNIFNSLYLNTNNSYIQLVLQK